MSQRWYDNPNAEPQAGHLIKDNSTIELFAWLKPDETLSGGDVFNGTPFSTGLPEDRIGAVQNYFAEYHLEYYRQRLYGDFPSRLHARLFFATRTDAENFRTRHPTLTSGKHLFCARSTGDYVVSYHDASWLDYLRLPHSLSLSTLDEIAGHYWGGTLVEEISLRFHEERWREPAVIEALFVGGLATHS